MTDTTIPYPQDAGQEVRVMADDLRDLLIAMLVKRSLFKFDARTVAERMVEADLRGIQSHGSRAIGRYLDAIDAGDIDPRARVLVASETPAAAVLDGSRAVGHVAATKAMTTAIEKAREVGTGTVAVGNSQHLGAASVYALLAARAGMIGFCTTSTGCPTVAACGSTQPAVANNALAWAVPMGDDKPFVLDMACGATSWGKVESLKMYGQPLPDDVALDAAGQPTGDPAAATTMLPAAGARGFGLAFVASVLAGPLAGGMLPIHRKRTPTADGSQHFFYAIDVSQFTDPEEFAVQLQSAGQQIRSLTPRDGVECVRLPGDSEAEFEQRCQAEGIPLHRSHAEDLQRRAEAMQVAVPWSTGG
ncbi:MAG: Ldh family oxidoreductase [Maioricimonas sp. JB049]